MDKKITAAIVALAVGLEAIFPNQDALPHTEVDARPQESGKDIPSVDGRRMNDGIRLTLIPPADLLTVTNGRHLSLKEIREDTTF
jgi:hypothetical protein